MKHLELNMGPCQYVWTGDREMDDLLPKRMDLPQEVFHSNSITPRNSVVSLEKVTMNYRASSEPAPDNFSQGLLIIGLAG